MIQPVDAGADHGYNPPTSSYQLPPEGVLDSYMILGNHMPLHNGGECVRVHAHTCACVGGTHVCMHVCVTANYYDLANVGK